MQTNLKKISIILMISALSAFAHAEQESIAVDPNIGRVGEPVRVPQPNEFKVCADPDNLPFSNSQGEGFENKIAELVAKDLGKDLSYQFWPDRFGFMRNTINAGRCDVMFGTVTANDALLTSKPIYRSGYAFVYRKDSGYNIKDWDSPDLRKGLIGLAGETPPSRPLADKDLLGNARPYRIMRDLTQPASLIMDDLAKGEIDVAILWGPIAGYYAKKSSVPMVVVPAPEYGHINPHGKLYWNISAAVRKKDKERMAMIQEVLDRRHDDILKILDEYGVPHVPIENERGEKR